MKTKVIALLLAGGHGFRMHHERPKQFIEIKGSPVFLYTIQAFEQHPEIDRVYMVCEREWNDYVYAEVKKAGFQKFAGTFQAGTTSLDSIKNGVFGLAQTINNQTNPIVLTHDSVRPLISREIISDNIETCLKYGNAITGITSCEAYMISPDGRRSEGMISREALYRAQTPQSFYLSDLLEIFKQAEEKGLTDSQSLYTLAASLECPLFISKGEELNFKLTVPTDIDMFSAIITQKQQAEY